MKFDCYRPPNSLNIVPTDSFPLFSDCQDDHKHWYRCRPCRKLFCGDRRKFFCPQLLKICYSPNCYCEPGFLWHNRKKKCVDEEVCRNIDYVETNTTTTTSTTESNEDDDEHDQVL